MLRARTARLLRSNLRTRLLTSSTSDNNKPPSQGITPYLQLSKYRLSSLVVVSTVFGYVLAPGPIAWIPLIGSSVGTSFCIAAANTGNQLIEVERDKRMVRTENRPLCRGTITKTQALTFGVGSAVIGSSLLLATTDGMMATGLAVSNIALYVGLYTPMKVHTHWNTQVGAIVGAIPPMIGWAAHTGDLGTGAFALGALLYCWQMPHFHALAYNLKDDYDRGGYKMLANTAPIKTVTKSVLTHSLALMGLAPLFVYSDITDVSFLATSLLPVSYMLYHAKNFHQDPNSKSARACFFATLRFLPAYMGLLYAHKWFNDGKRGEAETNDDGNDEIVMASH